MNATLPPVADAFIGAYKLHCADLPNETIRAVFRHVCYVPSWETTCRLGFRDIRLLKSFGHSLEMAYFDRENWAIMYVTALMLISKYQLLTLAGRGPVEAQAQSTKLIEPGSFPRPVEFAPPVGEALANKHTPKHNE